MEEGLEETPIEENIDVQDVGGESGIEPEVSESTEYEPNYSYKIKDDELEFDEVIRAGVVSKEAEEHLRDLYTRAGGLDSYKAKLAEKERILSDYQNKVEGFTTGFNQIRELRDSGEYRRLFGSIGLKDEQVLEYALKIAEEQELPPEQREIVSKNRKYEDQMLDLNRKLESYEKKFESFEQAQSQAEIKSGLSELESYISTRSDLNTFLKEKGIDLTSEVLQYGMNVYNKTKVEPSVEEAFNAVADRYAQFMPSNAETVTNIIKNREKGLPKISGSNQSAPEERMTLDKLRELASKVQ